ncbi:MAG: hypothetical protein JJU05_05105 [Verrucomicrobia bacterium]|nr:hypothetical protein [Verrucomicrobiota bacterium]MCH8525790.1 hypothetical protein [Kiritimatiellia bacterium]
MNYAQLRLTILVLMVSALGPVRADRVRLQFLSLEEGEIEGLHRRDEGEMLPVRIPSTFLLRPLSVSQNEPFILYLRNKQAGEDEDPWVEAHRVTFQRRVADAVVLVQTEGDRISTAVVPIEDQTFPPGSYMMFNRTQSAILIALNEEVTRIPPQRAAVLRPDLDQRRPMPVYFRSEQDDENRSLVTTTWFHDPANREFVFLSSPGINIRVRTVSRNPVPEE